MKKYLDKILIILAVIVVILGTYIKDKRDSKVIVVNEGEEEVVEEKEEINDGLDKVSNETLMAYISGSVLNPGVYEFNEGDRVIDLLEKAGGFLEDANRDVNLSMKLQDESHIYIPSKDEDVSISNNEISIGNKSNGKININTASKEELMSLSGIGEKKADEIIEYRESQKFGQIEDIMNISGIGEKTFEKLKDSITI